MDLPDANESFKSDSEESDDDLMIVPSESIQFYNTFHCRQILSFCDRIISYITKNPLSSKYYQKVIKTCKHFFIENKILVVPRMAVSHCDDNKFEIEFNDKMVDFKNISSTIWIRDQMKIAKYSKAENTEVQHSIIFSKIYQSDIKTFFLFIQCISYKNFILLTSNVENISICGGFVKNDNDTVVGLEDIIKACPKLLSVEYHMGNTPPNIITTTTVKELLTATNFSNLNKFDLYDIPEVFDMENFYSYIKLNKKTSIKLKFCVKISPAYKRRLQFIVDEIIETELHEYKIPLIDFLGITDNCFKSLSDLRFGH